MPSANDYIDAFEQLEKSISEPHRRMLRAHYHSGGRAITERELAKVAGYADYRVANIQYGSLAKRIGTKMNFTPALRQKTGRPLWTLVLGEGHTRFDFGLEFQWVMHKEVAEALEQIGWV